METPKNESWGFCETPEEKCTMNYCDDNGCQNRKRVLVSEEIPDTMETLYKIQPTEIEQLMQEKLADRKIDDEFGWTGEWRMSAKNVLDLIIDLNTNALEQIEKLEAEKKELLEGLEEVKKFLNYVQAPATPAIRLRMEIESLIQKHKQ